MHVTATCIAAHGGGAPLLDQAIARMPQIEELLFHGAASRPFAETQKKLQQLAGA